MLLFLGSPPAEEAAGVLAAADGAAAGDTAGAVGHVILRRGYLPE